MTEDMLTNTNQNDDKVKVLIVDDSPMMCKALEQILGEDEQIQVESRALNGQEALSKLASGKFDVCTLDVHMPGMNGLTVLKNIMVRYPVPTLMVSAFTGDGSRVTFEALRFGAVDFFKKPSRNGDQDLKDQAELLRTRLKRASRVQVSAARYLRIKPVGRIAYAENACEKDGGDVKAVAVIHGSTGAYSSLLSIIPALQPPLDIPVIVSLGIYNENLNAFVDYLRPFSKLPLVVPEESLPLRAGHVYFLPVDKAATFELVGGSWEIIVKERPISAEKEGAIDLILLSASEAFGEKCLAVFVSGDNSHGFTGAREVVRNGGVLLAQTPDNCLAPHLAFKMIRELEADSRNPAEIAHRLGMWR
ncbi:MAG: hypothetical protein DSZ23_03440 [Thermodesulfatator sp.]|nr:MAG: hypothetical protein DSZ23_03440 [Thermodesulfatator sp.]